MVEHSHDREEDDDATEGDDALEGIDNASAELEVTVVGVVVDILIRILRHQREQLVVATAAGK